MSTSYSFPTMAIPALVAAIQEIWELQVTGQQLSRPDQPFVTILYSRAVEYCLGITPQDVEDAHARVLSNSGERDDIAANTLDLIILFRTLKRVCSVAKFEDLRLSDIHSPDADRTIKILSALINFSQFKNEREPFTDGLQDASRNAFQERDRLAREIGETKAKIAAIEREREKELPLVQDLEDKITILNEELQELVTEQETTQDTLLELKEQRHALRRQAESIAEERRIAFETNIDIRSRIVEEPERLRNIIDDLSQQLAKQRTHLNDLDSKARELRNKIERSVVIEQDIRQATLVLKKTVQQIQELQRSTQAFAEQRSRLEQKAIDEREAEGKLQRTGQRLVHAQERVKDAHAMTQRKKEAAQAKLERLRIEHQQMSMERKDNDAEVAEMQAEIEGIEAEMAAQVQQNEAELNELLTAYWKARDEISLYIETISGQLGFPSSVS